MHDAAFMVVIGFVGGAVFAICLYIIDGLTREPLYNHEEPIYSETQEEGK